MTVRRGPAAQPGGAYTLALLFIANLLNYADRSLFGIVVEPIRRELGMNDTQISLLSGFVFILFNLVAGVAIARRVDRGGRRLILAGGIALWSLATAATALGQGFLSLAVCRLLVGIGEAVVFPVALSLLSDHYAGPRMPRAAAIFQSSAVVGVVIGSLLAGVLAAALGWRTMFVVCGLAGIVLVVLVLATLREPARAAGAVRRDPAGDRLWPTLAALARTPGLALLALGYGTANMMLGVLTAWAPAFLQRVHDVPLAQVGAVIGPPAMLGGVVGAVSAGIVASRLIARRGDRAAGLTVPILALPLALLGAVPMVFASSMPVVTIGIVLLNFFLVSALGPCVALALEIVPADRRALASTLMLIVQGLLGLGLAPLIVGIASDALTPRFGAESLRYALGILMATPLVASGLLWAALRQLRTSA